MARLPNVNCRYGAPMGRGQWHDELPTAPLKFRLSRVRINSGGYDRGGAYWGLGAPLYQASAEGTEWRECDTCGECHPYDFEGECREDTARRPEKWSDGVEFYVRATDRDDAKARVRAKYPNARFYN